MTIDRYLAVMNLRRMAPVMLVTMLLGGLAACGDDNETVAPPTTMPPISTSAADAVTTTAPAAVTTTRAGGATTTTVAGRRSCPARALPAGATDVVEKPGSGDYDGDGAADGLRSYRAGGMWHLRVEPAGGGAADLVVGEVAPGQAVSALGGARVDGDRGDEAFAIVGSGASTTIVGLFVLRSCALEWATLNGDKAAFPVGGSVGSGGGLSCQQPDRVVVYETVLDQAATGSGEPVYAGTATTYRLTGATLARVSSATATLKTGDPDYLRYRSFACGSLRL